MQYKSNVKAIISLITAILSVLCCCMWYVSLVMGIAAVVLGILGYRDENPKQKDAAIAGIVVGSVGVALAISVAVLRILFAVNLSPDPGAASSVAMMSLNMLL